MSEGAGGGYRFRLSRRHDPECVRRALSASERNFPCADLPRAGGGACGGRLCQSDRKGGRLHGDQRPRSHQPGHGDRYRVHGFHPGGRDHGQRESPLPGEGFLPGGGYRRRDHAHHQARIHRKGCADPGGYHPEGVSDRRVRPPGTGAGGCDQGCDGGGVRIHPGEAGKAAASEPFYGNGAGGSAEAPSVGKASFSVCGRRSRAFRRIGAGARLRASSGRSGLRFPDGKGSL